MAAGGARSVNQSNGEKWGSAAGTNPTSRIGSGRTTTGAAQRAADVFSLEDLDIESERLAPPVGNSTKMQFAAEDESLDVKIARLEAAMGIDDDDL